MSSVTETKGKLSTTSTMTYLFLLFIESELKQLLEASTKMNRAKILQIEQLTNTNKEKESKMLITYTLLY